LIFTCQWVGDGSHCSVCAGSVHSKQTLYNKLLFQVSVRAAFKFVRLVNLKCEVVLVTTWIFEVTKGSTNTYFFK